SGSSRCGICRQSDVRENVTSWASTKIGSVKKNLETSLEIRDSKARAGGAKSCCYSEKALIKCPRPNSKKGAFHEKSSLGPGFDLHLVRGVCPGSGAGAG